MEKHVRVNLKKFARIPINSPNHTLTCIAGDLTGQMHAAVNKIRVKLWKREGRDDPNHRDKGPKIDEKEIQQAFKHIPDKLA
jgi:hypothetical protein